jgi:hypothetical protein
MLTLPIIHTSGLEATEHALTSRILQVAHISVYCAPRVDDARSFDPGGVLCVENCHEVKQACKGMQDEHYHKDQHGDTCEHSAYLSLHQLHQPW